MTYPPINQPNPRRNRWPAIALGAFLVLAVGVCGLAALGAAVKGSGDTRDAAALGTPPQTSAAPAEAAATTTSAAAPATPAATPPPATTAPATSAPAVKATTAKPATKAPTTKAPKPAGNCNPNYSPCVPNDPVDVDCKGGSGNGPSYVQGPVRVIGTDVYDLDRDGDGTGCD